VKQTKTLNELKLSINLLGNFIKNLLGWMV